MKVYIITKYSLKFHYLYVDRVKRNLEDAKKYCEEQLNKEELEKHYKLLKRGLIKENEYSTKEYIYEIEEEFVNED